MGQGHSHAPPDSRRRLAVVLGLTVTVLVVEVVGAVVSGSLALLADAAHMLTDVAGLSMALVVAAIVRRPPSDTHTWGLRRAEVLGAAAQATLLLAVGGFVLVEAVRQLAAYFDGTLTDFDLPLAPQGSDFQQRVWEQLRGIGYGETASYGAIAHRLGMTNAASRAVGLANGRNPIPIVIPCHRVIGANGTLTGYAGGLERKQLLLDLERTDALF